MAKGKEKLSPVGRSSHLSVRVRVGIRVGVRVGVRAGVRVRVGVRVRAGVRAGVSAPRNGMKRWGDIGRSREI